MTIEKVRLEIKRRQSLAEEVHKRESASESPDIRAKESAWGKLVAYNKCLELLSQIK